MINERKQFTETQSRIRDCLLVRLLTIEIRNKVCLFNIHASINEVNTKRCIKTITVVLHYDFHRFLDIFRMVNTILTKVTVNCRIRAA